MPKPYTPPRLTGPFGDARTQRAALAAAKHEARAELLTQVVDVIERHTATCWCCHDVEEAGARTSVINLLRKWQATCEEEKNEAIEEFVSIIQANLKGAASC